jgi:TPR repeat protein
MYASGNGVARDPAMAQRLLEESVAQDNPQAKIALAKLLRPQAVESTKVAKRKPVPAAPTEPTLAGNSDAERAKAAGG